MVQGDAVRHQPVDEHVVRRSFDNTVVPKIRVEPFQEDGQCVFTVLKERVFSGELVYIVKHLHPDQGIGGVEHPAVPVAEQFRSAAHIQSGQPKISEGEGCHQSFDVVIPGAGQQLAMLGAVQVNGLAAVFQSMDAGIQHLVQILIRGSGFGAEFHGIMGGNEGKGKDCVLIAPVFRFHPEAADAVQFQSQAAAGLRKSELLQGTRLPGFPAPDVYIQFTGYLGGGGQIGCVNFVEGQQMRYRLAWGNRDGTSLLGFQTI